MSLGLSPFVPLICHSRVGGNPVVALVSLSVLGLSLGMIRKGILFVTMYAVRFYAFYVWFLWIPAFAGMTAGYICLSNLRHYACLEIFKIIPAIPIVMASDVPP